MPDSNPPTYHVSEPRATLTRTRISAPPALRLAACLLIAATLPAAQAGPPAQPTAILQNTAAGARLSVPPESWAAQCGTNEALVIQHPGSYLRYHMHVVDEKGDHVRDQIESTDGSVGRTILRDGRPLTPEEDAAERERLTALLGSPAIFARHIRNEEANKKMGIDMLKLMPGAMRWSYTPGQPQTPPHNVAPNTSHEPLVVLDFTPNPNWSAPSITAQALTGLQGRLWIDPETRQIVGMQGVVVHPVNIGWGVVAHLYPGGTISLQQSHVAGDRWIAGHVEEQLVVRALMLKTIRQRLVYDTFAYQVVPAMTYQQAIKTLLDTPLPQH